MITLIRLFTVICCVHCDFHFEDQAVSVISRSWSKTSTVLLANLVHIDCIWSLTVVECLHISWLYWIIVKVLSSSRPYQALIDWVCCNGASAYQTDVFSGDRSILPVGLTHSSGSNLEIKYIYLVSMYLVTDFKYKRVPTRHKLPAKGSTLLKWHGWLRIV